MVEQISYGLSSSFEPTREKSDMRVKQVLESYSFPYIFSYIFILLTLVGIREYHIVEVFFLFARGFAY